MTDRELLLNAVSDAKRLFQDIHCTTYDRDGETMVSRMRRLGLEGEDRMKETLRSLKAYHYEK
jgi:hypothetical protein